MKRTLVKILSAGTGLVLAAATGAAAYAAIATEEPSVVRQVTVTGATEAAAADTLDVASVYERARDAVVEITAMSAGLGGFGPGAEAQQAQGSGFVLDEQGHVVTNEHVVSGAERISVQLASGERYEATLVGSDESTDLAVLRIDAPASELEPLELGDSSGLRVGEGVVAIGSPFGLEGSVSAGVVSALDRQMEAQNGFTINGSIQTDAAINHGNSGGPLLNLAGEVVGVNAQIASESGGSDGVGFAIPSNTVASVVEQLLAGGGVEHAYLGVGLAELESGEGVEVSEVRPGTPAAEAGLEAGDVVTAVDGDAVSSPADLQTAIDAKRPGDAVTLTVVRDGESRPVEVELAERPA